MKIRVLSFDFDGCLFNRSYQKRKGVLKANKSFLETIKKENEEFDRVIIFIGSARQSKVVDDSNSQKNRTASCFLEIMRIKQYLTGATLDPLLLADIHGNLEPGKALGSAYLELMFSSDISEREQAMKLAKELKLVKELKLKIKPIQYFCGWDMLCCSRHPTSPFDHTKFTLLYAQTHKIAQQYPREEITFDFYDDKNHILEGLQGYFTEHTHLLAKNIDLRLKHYKGGSVTEIAHIKGLGDVDTHYYKTVRKITKQSLYEQSNTIRPESLNIPKKEIARKTFFSNSYNLLFNSNKLEDKNETFSVLHDNSLEKNRC